MDVQPQWIGAPDAHYSVEYECTDEECDVEPEDAIAECLAVERDRLRNLAQKGEPPYGLVKVEASQCARGWTVIIEYVRWLGDGAAT